jgi:phosphoinositide-3-kinase, regulatory subunit 4
MVFNSCQNMILDMIRLDPSTRPTFDSLLHVTRGTVFPESFFSFLHNYVASVNELSIVGGDFMAAVSSTSTASVSTLKPQAATPHLSGDSSNSLLPSDSDHRMERIWADYESVVPYITQDIPEMTKMDWISDELSSFSSMKPLQVSSNIIQFKKCSSHLGCPSC